MTLTLGYSPCPNDTTLFHALAHGRVAPELSWRIRLDDVEALNRWALDGDPKPDVCKVSYHAFGHLGDSYLMLASGGALGRGVGPLVVTREPLADLTGRRVATPGGLTTANLLLDLSQRGGVERVELRYDRILPAVAAGEVDAGLIIHESRFTYPAYGLIEHLDLGAWWEAETGMLLPLGGIVARRALGETRLRTIETAIRDSLAYARAHPGAADAYVAAHAQEMDPEVRRRHVELYLNDASYDLGAEGRAAVRELLGRAAGLGLIPTPSRELFLAPGNPHETPLPDPT